MILRLDPEVSDTTKRYARTLESAFGPHTSRFDLEEAPQPKPSRAHQLIVAAAIAVGTVAGTLFALWLVAGPGVVR